LAAARNNEKKQLCMVIKSASYAKTIDETTYRQNKINYNTANNLTLSFKV
jgi:hypothetical protein